MGKVALAQDFMARGLKRDICLALLRLRKNQFYYKLSGASPGNRQSEYIAHFDGVHRKQVSNDDVIERIIQIKSNADLPNWYRLITHTLQLEEYYINHKKVYLLMKTRDLLDMPMNGNSGAC